MTNFWIGTVSQSHIQRGLAGGFIQLNHGKRAPLLRMQAGDRIAIYSPRTDYPDGALLQAFTAIGAIKSGQVYQFEMSDTFRPYRIDVDFLDGREAAIKPLIAELSFIRSKTHWGGAFRFGYVKVPETDFACIANAMGISNAS